MSEPAGHPHVGARGYCNFAPSAIHLPSSVRSRGVIWVLLRNGMVLLWIARSWVSNTTLLGGVGNADPMGRDRLQDHGRGGQHPARLDRRVTETGPPR